MTERGSRSVWNPKRLVGARRAVFGGGVWTVVVGTMFVVGYFVVTTPTLAYADGEIQEAPTWLWLAGGLALVVGVLTAFTAYRTAPTAPPPPTEKRSAASPWHAALPLLMTGPVFLAALVATKSNLRGQAVFVAVLALVAGEVIVVNNRR